MPRKSTHTTSARRSKSQPSERTAANGNNFLDEASEKATTLILDRGYDNTPMSAIAKALGMTKAGVYHHFETKEDLLYAVHRRAIDGRLLPIVTLAEKIEEPELRLRTFITEFALLMTRDPSARILINEARRLSADRFAEVRGVWRRVFDLVRGAIERLQESGRCRDDIDPRFAAFSALGMCGWILYWFDYDRPSSGEKVAATICRIFMSGILNQRPPIKQASRKKS